MGLVIVVYLSLMALVFGLKMESHESKHKCFCTRSTGRLRSSYFVSVKFDWVCKLLYAKKHDYTITCQPFHSS